MNQAQLALPGVATETAEWVWTEETGEEAFMTDFIHTKNFQNFIKKYHNVHLVPAKLN